MGCPLYQFVYNSVCYFACPIKTYPDYSTYLCADCDPKCLECTGPSSQECLECATNYYFLGNDCLLSCPEGYFAQKTPTNACKTCYYDCKTCIESVLCSTCPYTRYQNPSFAGTCSVCSSGCKICSSSKICTACEPGYYLSNSNCVTSCPINYTPDSLCEQCILGTIIPICKICNNGFFYDTNRCKACDAKCSICYGTSSAECTQCSTGYFLFNTECISTCPDGYYSYSIPKNTCFRCVFYCKTCTGYNTCISCISGYFFENKGCTRCQTGCQTCKSTSICLTCKRNYYLNNGICSTSCPVGYFKNPISTICEKCSNTCKSCVSDLSCSSCICDACNDGYFLVADKCIKCDSKCSKCDGPDSTQCLVCLSPYYLYQSTCSLDCPSGFWKSDSDLTCKNCHFSCKSCESGNLDNQCTDCIDGFVFLSGMCKACSITCLKCLSSPAFCTECNSDLILVSNNCVSCEEGYWKSKELESCEPCHASCKTCSGGNQNNQCTSCITSFYIKNNYCEQCSSNCLECKNTAEQCVVCHDKYYLDLRYLNCVASCPDETWKSSIDLKCVVCDVSCKTCSGSSDNNCLSCPEKKYLTEGKCVAVCLDGFFSDNNLKKCTVCHSSCKTCLGSSLSDCSLCFSNTYFLKINEELNIGSCYIECPVGYRINKTDWVCLKRCQENEYEDLNNICQMCNENCGSCDGSFQDNCLFCKNGKVLMKKSCIENCPDKYYNASSVCKGFNFY